MSWTSNRRYINILSHSLVELAWRKPSLFDIGCRVGVLEQIPAVGGIVQVPLVGADSAVAELGASAAGAAAGKCSSDGTLNPKL